MNTKTHRRHLRLPASTDAAILEYADSHHKSVTWAVIQAIDLLTEDGRKPATPSTMSQVSADIARMLQVSVFVANSVRELKAELLRQGDVRLALGEAAKLTDLMHQLDKTEATLTSLRRQLALHLAAMPAAKHTVRTNRRRANERATEEALR
ncbi:MAG: hypothetical protein HZA32_16770 [Opitutae bacterium]|nr:hypothetical protein [Opitutae bacterium]